MDEVGRRGGRGKRRRQRGSRRERETSCGEEGNGMARRVGG